MQNPYLIILSLFVLAGLLTTLWGIKIVLRARKTREFPSVEGIIEESSFSSGSDDLLPHIVFSYSVDSQTYRQAVEFPGDVTPTKEFTSHYLDSYRIGSKVQVYYDPRKPGNATLEPGLAKGDWLVLGIGLGTLVFGLIFLFSSW